MIKSTCLTLILTAFNSVYFAQTPSFEWVQTFGNQESESGKALAVDSQNNVYTAGNFKGTLDFDPGTGVTNLYSGGGNNGFIQKLNPAGGFIWAKVFPSGSIFTFTSITIDSQDNLIIAGNFIGTTSFPTVDSTSTISNTNPQRDAFIVKMNAAGQFLWAKSFGNPNDTEMDADQINSIKTDSSGNIYSTGYYYGIADFDPGPAIANLNNYSSNHDVFIQKLDPQGNYLWAKRAGGSGFDQGISLDVYQNTILITGWFQLSVDFNPSSATNQLISEGSSDIFLLFLTNEGNFIRVKQFGGPITDKGVEVATNNLGEIYLTGTYSDTIDLDPGIGSSFVSSLGTNFFIVKMTQQGDFIWGKSLSSSGSKYTHALDVFPTHGVVVSGLFSGTVDFDPGNDVSELDAVEASDIFLLYLDQNGNYVWAGSYGNGSISDNDFINDLVTDHSGNIYSTGWFVETVDFDCGTGIEERTSILYDDIFVLKMNVDLLSLSEQTLPDIKLYPNPASQNLFISSKSLNNYHITIVNTLGRIVLEEDLSGSMVSVDIESLSTGSYVLQLTGEFGSQYQTFVKTH